MGSSNYCRVSGLGQQDEQEGEIIYFDMAQEGGRHERQCYAG